jgi:hypothetical protein
MLCHMPTQRYEDGGQRRHPVPVPLKIYNNIMYASTAKEMPVPPKMPVPFHGYSKKSANLSNVRDDVVYWCQTKQCRSF